MTKGPYRKVIQFYKPHGVKGAVKGEFLYPFKDQNNLLDHCFIEQGHAYMPLFMDKIEITQYPSAIFYLEDISSKESADMLRNAGGFIPEEQFTDLFTEDHESELLTYLNYECFLNENERIGRITDIWFTAGQDIFVLDNEGKELLIPVNEDLISKIDESKQAIYFSLPEGLLDL